VTDVTDALVAAVSVPWVPELVAVNIGSGKATPIHGLWREIAGLTGATAAPKHVLARSGDIRRSRADISRAADLLGWRPRTDLATGLAGMIEERNGRRQAAAVR
jgi:nucleoside-diphosphate-sugar epimerase